MREYLKSRFHIHSARFSTQTPWRSAPTMALKRLLRTRPSRNAERTRPGILLAALLLLIAAWFRVWQIDRVPPGLHHDEVISSELVEQNVLAGRPAIFYDRGGREGLFHLTSAAPMALIGYNPIGLRGAGLAWGMIGLAATYALAARLLGRRTGLIALAFAATSLWSVYEGRAATRSVSLMAMSALAALAFFVAWSRTPRPRSEWSFALAGALVGLSLYTYIAARVVPLVFALLIAYLAVTQRRAVSAAWRGLVVYAAAALAVGAPLAIYLYSHPAADMRFQMLAQPLAELGQGNPWPVIGTTLQTLGMFVWRGDPQWHYNVAGLPVFGPASAALFLVGLGLALRRIKQLPYAFYTIWLFVSLVPGMLSEPAPHYMRTAGAQAAAYTLLGIGGAAIVEMARSRSLRMSAPKGLGRLAPGYDQVVWLGLALVWLGATLHTWQNFFVIWPANDEVRFYHQANVSEMARYLDAQPDTTPVVGCSPFLDEREDWLRSPRQTMHFVLRRADLPIRWNDCRDSLVFPNGGARWRQFILYLTPIQDNIPPALLGWFTGAPPVPIGEFADSTLYTPEVQDRLTAALAQARQAEAAWDPAGGGGPAALPADLGHSLNFMGYTVNKAALRAGKQLTLTTYWQAIGPSPPFLTVFVHLLDASGRIAAQDDRQSVLADTLQPGDVFMQIHSLDLPLDLPPGAYRLSIGLYSSQTGQRLPVYQGQLVRGDRLMLQAITIK